MIQTRHLTAEEAEPYTAARRKLDEHEAKDLVTLREVVDWVSVAMCELADEDSRRSMKHRTRLAVERYAVLVAMLLEDQPESGTG